MSLTAAESVPDLLTLTVASEVRQAFLRRNARSPRQPRDKHFGIILQVCAPGTHLRLWFAFQFAQAHLNSPGDLAPCPAHFDMLRPAKLSIGAASVPMFVFTQRGIHLDLRIFQLVRQVNRE